MPKPSVALCSAKPMTSTVARATSPLAADWPMARPSAKLCRPMPTAISSAVWRALLHDATPRVAGGRSSTDIAPGPPRPTACLRRCR